MADRQDYYEILGVSRTATADEIKHAYRLKVRDTHPDTHRDDPDAERKYKQVNEAYAVLSDPAKRQRYDQFGTADENPGMGGNPFGGAEDIFGDFFGSMFGGGFSSGTRADAPRRGSDLQLMVSISLEEAASGAVRKVTIPRWEPCDHCHGTGAEPGHEPRECPTCHGAGQVRQRMRTIFGEAVSMGTCPNCGGRGKIIDKACTECGGEGRIHRRREQEVKIPAGIETGTRLRVAGAGELGLNGGTPGDLYIVVEVREHSVFQRDGADLHRDVTIPWPLAVLGGSGKVGTLSDGDADYKVPEGTASGSTIRVAGKGLPYMRGSGRGDLYLHVTVDVPKPGKLSEHGAELVRELAEELHVSGMAHEDEGGLFGGLFGGKKSQSTKKKSKKK